MRVDIFHRANYHHHHCRPVGLTVKVSSLNNKIYSFINWVLG